MCTGIEAAIGLAAGIGAGIGIAAAAGVGTGLAAAGEGTGLGVGRFPFVSFEGRPPGPPGLIRRPEVNGFGATGLPFGKGFDREVGGSPAWV